MDRIGGCKELMAEVVTQKREERESDFSSSKPSTINIKLTFWTGISFKISQR